MQARSGFKVKGLRWWIIGLVTLGTICNYLARSALGVAAPTFMHDLQINPAQYAWIVSAFQGMYAVGAPICGYLLDVIGLKIGFAIFAVLWSVLNLAHGFATGWPMLALLRGGMGLTEATAMPAGMKATAEWFPANERGIAVGVFNTGTSLGAMLAPPLVVWAILQYNWQAAFYVTGLIGLAWAVLWLICYQSPEKHTALTEVEHQYIVAGQVQALAGGVPSKPSVWALLQQRNLWGIALPRMLANPAWGTLNFWMPLYLISVRHMELKEIALFAWLPFLTADLGCVFGGALSSGLIRYCGVSLINARRITFTLGALLMTPVAAVTLVDNVYVAISLFCMAGFAHQCLSTTVITMSADLFPRQEVGTVTGLAALAGGVGDLSFNLVIGALVMTVGYSPFFIALGIFDLIGAACLWLMVQESAVTRTADEVYRQQLLQQSGK